MDYWFLVIVCGVMFLLQMAFGLIQSKAFSHAFVAMRRKGQKVATGKHKALFSAGSIVMFAVTNSGKIVDGTSIKGITVFARFKPLKTFNGQYLTELDQSLLEQQPIAIQKAIQNAIETWVAVHEGRAPVEPPEAVVAFIAMVKGRVNAIKSRFQNKRHAIAN